MAYAELSTRDEARACSLWSVQKLSAHLLIRDLLIRGRRHQGACLARHIPPTDVAAFAPKGGRPRFVALRAFANLRAMPDVLR
eukprot:CAMPEP_0176184320 /NCGR_PEP_ID=MMETSP0121_2-20121125/755_1 /TAXON_ID=160619 /ORGANISM="Kryptoperidinium foliaceum, Strain CCMP 1326" /LENGTH=82 /DNA_ID=CAMNT_0017522693 /DNA_START=6 /DNA_END=254 /DNA_ORIENTATION=-